MEVQDLKNSVVIYNRIMYFINNIKMLFILISKDITFNETEIKIKLKDPP